MEHHQRAGRLPPAPADQVIATFLGPVLTQAALDITSGRSDARTFDTPNFDTPNFDTPNFDTPNFDARAHVRRFLNGFLSDGPER